MAELHRNPLSIAEFVTEWMADSGYADQPLWTINTGDCADFANFVADGHEDVVTITGDSDLWTDEGGDFDPARLAEASAKPLPGMTWGEFAQNFKPGQFGHVWLLADGKHYDAEVPEGVESFWELPCVRRALVEVLEQTDVPMLEKLIAEHSWWQESLIMSREFCRWFDGHFAQPVEQGREAACEEADHSWLSRI